MRPIPEEMLKYAREDTHYLLYIYDVLRTELHQMGLKQDNSNAFGFILQTMHKSNGIALRNYEKPILKDYNFQMQIQRTWASQGVLATKILKAMLKWRDFTARKEDESCHYIMPNHVLY